MNIKNKIRIITSDNPFNLAKRRIEDLDLVAPCSMSSLLPAFPKEHTIVYKGRVIDEINLKSTRVRPGDSINLIRKISGGGGGDKAGGVGIMIAAMGVSSLVGGGVLGALLAAGISYLGGMVISWLEPVKKDNTSNGATNYGWNTPNPKLNQSSPVEITFGTARMKAPQILGILATNETTVNGTVQFLNMILSAGEGPLDSITNIMINGNPVANLGVAPTIETRLGTNDQEALTIQALMDTFSTETLSFAITDVPQTAQTNASNANAIEVSLLFPQGIYARSRSTNPTDGSPTAGTVLPVDFEILIEYRVTGTSTWSKQIYPFLNEMETGATHKTFRISGLTPAQYDVRVTRDWLGKANWYYNGANGVQDRWVDIVKDTYGNFVLENNIPCDVVTNCSWDGLTAYISQGLVRPNKALVAIQVQATGQISGGIPTISWTQTRASVWVWNPYTLAYEQKSASNPWWAAYDLIHYCRRLKNINTGEMEFVVYGAPAASMIYDQFLECADYCDANKIAFNFILDAAGSLQDALKFCQDVGRGTVLIKGTSFGCTMDKPGDPVQIFTMGNIQPKTFKENFLAIASRANAVEISYMKNNDAFQTEWEETTLPVYPVDWDDIDVDQNPTQLKLDGITNQDQAYAQGKWFLRCNRFLIRTCEFEVGLDALGSDVGDIIALQHDVPQWGWGGRVLSQPESYQVKLDRTVTFENGVNYSLTIRHAESDTLMTYPVTGTGTTDTITIDGDFFAPLIPFDDIWAFGQTNIITKPFRIIAISRAMELTRKITCMEYNPAIYDTSDLAGGFIPVINYSQLRTSVEVMNLAGTVSVRLNSNGIVDSDIVATWQLPPSQGEIIKNFHVYISVNGGAFTFWEITTDFKSTITSLPAGTYIVQVRTENLQGLISNGAVSGGIAVTNILTPPPDPDGLTCHQQMDGTWTLAVIYNAALPPDFLGWVFKIRAGTRAYWQDAAMLTAVPVNQNSIIIPGMPAGEQTLMVKMQLKSGAQSVNLAEAVAQIGDPITPNIVNSFDLISLGGWTITNGSLTGGEIKADADSGGLFWQASGLSPAWSLRGSDLYWDRGNYKQMTAISETVSFGETGFIVLNYNIAGPYQVYYRQANLTPAAPWQLYTGIFSTPIISTTWKFKIVTGAGALQGDITKFIAIITCVPVINHLPDTAIDIAGTRVPPASTYQNITNCQATLQVSVSYPAVTITFSDRMNPLGPLWQGYDANGNPAAALADITYEGY